MWRKWGKLYNFFSYKKTKINVFYPFLSSISIILLCIYFDLKSNYKNHQQRRQNKLVDIHFFVNKIKGQVRSQPGRRPRGHERRSILSSRRNTKTNLLQCFTTIDITYIVHITDKTGKMKLNFM